MKFLILIIFGFINFSASSQNGNFTNDYFEGRSVYFFSPTFPETEGWIRLLNDDGSNVANRAN